MNNSASSDDSLDLLKLRAQNLKVLLEEAILSGSHRRMKQLLADIKLVEDKIVEQRERENDNPWQTSLFRPCYALQLP